MFRLGYNTNGLAFHRPGDALDLVADLGYEAVAITPDVGALDPFCLSSAEVQATRARLGDLGLAVAIESGARFVMDPRRKHRPTLLEDAKIDRARRIDFYFRCIDLAVELGAGVVSLWAGAIPEGPSASTAQTLEADPEHPLLDRLASGLAEVLARARTADVRIAFEPEPGMFIERPVGFQTLISHMGSAADDLGLTLDVGHCVVTGDEPVSDVIHEFASRLIHVHMDDCPKGVHSHVPFGEGDLDLHDTLAGLSSCGFEGIAAVELSRDSHRAPDAARHALAAIRAAL